MYLIRQNNIYCSIMDKIKISNNLSNDELAKIIINVGKLKGYVNNAYTLIIVRLFKKIIKYNKLNIFLDVIKSNNLPIWKSYLNLEMEYDIDKQSNRNKSISQIPLYYIYKYAYYHKNPYIVMQIYNIYAYINKGIYDYIEGYIPSECYDLIALSYIKYIKNKKSNLYKKICKIYTTEKIFNMQINNEKHLDILNIFYKYNGKIKIYNDDDSESCKTIYQQIRVPNNCMCKMCSMIDCESINLNEIMLNCKTYKYLCIPAKKQILSCIYLYYKEYENKKITKIDFNLIYNFIIDIKQNLSEYALINTYITIAKFTLIYCSKYKNLEILSELEKYLSKLPTNLNLFEIIHFLSSHYNCEYDKNIERYNTMNIQFNQNNLEIFTKEPYFSIIKQILNNDLFYNNIDNMHYIPIYKIINNDSPSKIDQIIINQIMKTNITNTHEYTSAVE